MNREIERKIGLFVENRAAVGDAYKFDYGLNCLVSSLILTGANRTADIESMKEAQKILSTKAGALSTFRVTCELAVVTKMSMQADPEGYIDDVMEVYKIVRGKRIMEYHGLVLTAMTIVDLGRKNEAEKITAKMEEILKRMSKEHPFLTDENDIAFAALLAMTEKDVDTIICEMEECYNYMKKDLKIKADSNAIQGLSELIILNDGDLKEKCDRAAEIYAAFKEHGSKYGDYYEFSSLGALIGIDMDKDELVDLIIEVEENLKESKGFGSWDLDRRQRLMFAAILVSEVLADNTDRAYDYAVNSAVINNTIAAIISEEIAVMMCSYMAASTTMSNI